MFFDYEILDKNSVQANVRRDHFIVEIADWLNYYRTPPSSRFVARTRPHVYLFLNSKLDRYFESHGIKQIIYYVRIDNGVPRIFQWRGTKLKKTCLQNR